MNNDHRQIAADLILAFLSAKIDETDHAAYNQIRNSEDDTVRFACEILEELVEAYEDEPTIMDKEEWDHLERIRLVLLSGRHLSRDGSYVFEPAQFVAVIALIAYLITFVCFGIGWYLVPVHAMSAVLGLALGRLVKNKRRKHPFQHITYPFMSYAQLAAAYREAKEFRKKRMPRDAQLHKFPIWCDIAIAFAVLLLMAPVFLLTIGLEGGSEYRVANSRIGVTT